MEDEVLLNELVRRCPETISLAVKAAPTTELMYELLGREDIGKYGPSLEDYIEMLRKIK